MAPLCTVLSVVSTLADCGPVRVLHGILRDYDGERFRAVVATLSPEAEPSRAADFHVLGVRLEPLGLSRFASLLLGRERLERLARKVGAGAIHCHGVRADVLAGAMARRLPLISTIHADLDAYYRSAYGPLLGSAMASREYAALRRFAAPVAVSSAVAAAAQGAGVQARTIRNGIDLARFAAAGHRESRRRCREAQRWRQEQVVILHCGVLMPGKRPLELIEAFQRAGLGCNAVLVFAGDGPLRPACERRARNWSNIRFLGHRPDVSELLGAADLLVSNSTTEGMPLALLEACASGLPVLATGIPAHRELRELFPSLITLFQAGDAKEFAEALATAARSRSERGDNLVPPAMEKISDRTMSLRYQELYASLL